MSALHGLAADMQLPLDHFTRLVGDPMTEASDEEDCVLLSAMQLRQAASTSTAAPHPRRRPDGDARGLRPAAQVGAPAGDRRIGGDLCGRHAPPRVGGPRAGDGRRRRRIGATLPRGRRRRPRRSASSACARPSPHFDCGALAGRAGAVARFVDGREASTSSSVAELPLGQRGGGEAEGAAGGHAIAADDELDELLEDGLDALVQEVYDDMGSASSPAARADTVGAMTDELAGQTDFEPSPSCARCSASYKRTSSSAPLATSRRAVHAVGEGVARAAHRPPPSAASTSGARCSSRTRGSSLCGGREQEAAAGRSSGGARKSRRGSSEHAVSAAPRRTSASPIAATEPRRRRADPSTLPPATSRPASAGTAIAEGPAAAGQPGGGVARRQRLFFKMRKKADGKLMNAVPAAGCQPERGALLRRRAAPREPDARGPRDGGRRRHRRDDGAGRRLSGWG